MWSKVNDRMSKYRQSKPIEELARKAKKAMRKGIWTQEEIDYAIAVGIRKAKLFDRGPETGGL